MARWSPTREVTTTVPTIYDALNELVDRGAMANDRRMMQQEQERARGLEDEERGRRQGREDLATALSEISFQQAGGRRFETPPTRELSPDEDVFAGARPGMAAQVGGGGIFEGARPGMGGGVADQLEQVAFPGRPRTPSIIAPAGAFVPGVGFAPRHITDRDMQPSIGMTGAGRGPRQVPDSRYTHLTGDRYLDTQAGRVEDAEDPMALAQALMAMGATQEEAMLVLQDPARATQVLSRIEGREQQFSEEELRAAGIPENQISAALRDPQLARQLMTARDPAAGGAGRQLTPQQQLNQQSQERDAFISRLIAQGQRDPQRLLAAAADRFPDTPTTLRDVRNQLAAEDPMIDQRRDAIYRVAHPVSFGGGGVLYQIVEDLAQGKSRQQIEDELAEAFLGEEGHPELQAALEYLDVIAGSAGLGAILNIGGR